MKATAPKNTAPHQHPTALIRRRDVEKLTCLSRSRIYDLMSRGEFPKPVRLGVMSVAWPSNEIQDWIDARIAARIAA